MKKFSNIDEFINLYNIDLSWKDLFIRNKNIIFDIHENLNYENIIYPSEDKWYSIFKLPLYEIKLVLLGQDPYHNPNQAMGFSFSVPNNCPIPPSLKNIFKEIQNEYPNKYTFLHGNLSKWVTDEKIFLLNCALTVEHNKPGSHLKKWEIFTNDVIKFISDNNKHVLFLLLGNYAKSKSKYINNIESIISASHPSPLSAHNGFFNSNVFRCIDAKLEKNINWQN